MPYTKDTSKNIFFGIWVCVVLILVVYVYQAIFFIPTTFPAGKSFTVGENETLKSVSSRLENEGYIRSSLFFRAGLSFFGKDKNIQLGSYIFDTPQSLLRVISTFAEGHPNLPLLSVTIPEGSTVSEIADLIHKGLPTFSQAIFETLVRDNHAEGKLFPSTYFLLPSYSEKTIMNTMVSTFAKKVIIPSSQIVSPLHSENDVLVLASILEGEAKLEEDKAIVAGILLTRLSKGMPLQVDVAKETYKQKGLPLVPLNNPGIIAINAALHPTVTPYLFYITGKDGKMYYAKTFEEHKKNIKKYL